MLNIAKFSPDEPEEDIDDYDEYYMPSAGDDIEELRGKEERDE